MDLEQIKDKVIKTSAGVFGAKKVADQAALCALTVLCLVFGIIYSLSLMSPNGELVIRLIRFAMPIILILSFFAWNLIVRGRSRKIKPDFRHIGGVALFALVGCLCYACWPVLCKETTGLAVGGLAVAFALQCLLQRIDKRGSLMTCLTQRGLWRAMPDLAIRLAVEPHRIHSMCITWNGWSCTCMPSLGSSATTREVGYRMDPSSKSCHVWLDWRLEATKTRSPMAAIDSIPSTDFGNHARRHLGKWRLRRAAENLHAVWHPDLYSEAVEGPFLLPVFRVTLLQPLRSDNFHKKKKTMHAIAVQKGSVRAPVRYDIGVYENLEEGDSLWFGLEPGLDSVERLHEFLESQTGAEGSCLSLGDVMVQWMEVTKFKVPVDWDDETFKALGLVENPGGTIYAVENKGHEGTYEYYPASTDRISGKTIFIRKEVSVYFEQNREVTPRTNQGKRSSTSCFGSTGCFSGACLFKRSISNTRIAKGAKVASWEPAYAPRPSKKGVPSWGPPAPTASEQQTNSLPPRAAST